MCYVCQEVSGTSFAFRWSVWGRQNLQERLPVTREGNTHFYFFPFSLRAFLTFPPQRQLLWGWAVWSDTGRGGCSSAPSRWHIPEVRVESHLWNGPSTHIDSPCRWGARCMQDFESHMAFMWINSTYILRDWCIPTPHVNSVAIFLMHACVWPALCQRTGLLCSREEDIGEGTQKD